jgi:uncharacterized protein YciI
MPLFVLACHDRPGALDLRMATREAHLGYIREHADRVKLGGPFLNAEGGMAGSLLIIEAESEADALAFSEADPYRRAGLFGRVDITPFRATVGAWVA